MKKQYNIGVRVCGLGLAVYHSAMAALWTNCAGDAHRDSAKGFNAMTGRGKTGKERAAGAASMVLNAIMGERCSAWAREDAAKAHEAWEAVFDGKRRW